MHEVSKRNPYTPDIDITQLAILTKISKDLFIPSRLANYEPLTTLVDDLITKDYLTKEEIHLLNESMYYTTEKCKERIEVYKQYEQIKPAILNYCNPEPENQLEVIRQKLRRNVNSGYRNYLYSYESLLVYQLNQALMKTQP
jgi:hypothetical protein